MLSIHVHEIIEIPLWFEIGLKTPQRRKKTHKKLGERHFFVKLMGVERNTFQSKRNWLLLKREPDKRSEKVLEREIYVGEKKKGTDEKLDKKQRK